MRMVKGWNYQPVMIRTLMQNNGKSSKEKIMEELQKENLEYELSHFLNLEVFRELTISHPIAKEDKENKAFVLIDYEKYSIAEKAVIIRYCNQKIIWS